MRQQQQQQKDNSKGLDTKMTTAAAPIMPPPPPPASDNPGDTTNGDDTHTGGRHPKRRQAAPHHAVYDELIGAIDQGTSSTRFLVFEKGTGQLVASSQLEIKRITPREGWVEIDPNSIMSSVYATMANVHDQLLAKQHQFKISAPATTAGDQLCDTSFLLDDQHKPAATAAAAVANQMFLKCIGICNQRESAVVWDSKTGQPLYNVIVWMDNRTKDIVDDMIDSIPGRDFNHMKDKTGLPMSTYFSAFKLRWLIDNVAEVKLALKEKRLLVGTVDSWILWNLTGKHLTDVTNASRTFLMDIETLQWDKSLCKQFKVPMEILPKILSSADDFGQLQFGPFMGTPVTGVIGDQSAALFGHNCLQLGQTKATFGTGCFIMQNIGPGPLNGALSGVQREAKRGLITTVGYKLKDKPVCYALEGSIKIAGAALTWLRDNMQLIQNYEECDQLVNTTTHSAGVFFVPALGGLYSPYWDPNAAGLFIGLSQFTRREHLVRATFDSIAFQTNDILSLMRGVTNGLMIDGGLCKSDNLCQILADITGCDIVRPSMCETSALGAAMVAGCGAGIWDYDSMLAQSNTPYEYSCSAHQTHHYPHESLHYDDNKFSSLIQTKSSFINSNGNNNSGSNGHNHSNHHNNNNSNSSSNKQRSDNQQHQQQEIQHQLQPTKHHRRSLRHRNGTRLMRNLDAGGGINDDAGGGGGGGPISPERAPERLQQLAAAAAAAAAATHHHHHHHHHRRSSLVNEPPPSSSDDEDDDDDEVDIASSSGDGAHLASSDNDFDAGAVVLSSSDPSSTVDELVNIPGVGVAAGSRIEITSGGPLPAVLENHAIESSYESVIQTDAASERNDLSTGLGNSKQATRTLTSLISGHRHGAPCSSGYSSGDNFELATTNSSSALTDSIRLLGGTRTDSPVESQATDALTMSGRDSVATCTEDFAKHHHQHHLDQLTNDNDCVASTNATGGTRANGTIDSYLGSSQLGGEDDDQARSSIQAGSVGPVQANNNRKFEANAEDVADEVHEFGGRDSFGEDGYDSSTVSFDSYDDDEAEDDNDADGVDVLIGCDNKAENVEDDVAYYGDDNDETYDQDESAQLNHRDVIKSTDNNSSAGLTMMRADSTANQNQHHHNNHHHHNHHNTSHSHKDAIDASTVANNNNSKQHRRKQASLLEKQMDVFQPYISLEHRTELVDTWRLAVNRSMQWTKVHHEEIRRIDYQRLSSLPISMYVFFSIGLVALSGFLSPTPAIFSAAHI